MVYTKHCGEILFASRAAENERSEKVMLQIAFRLFIYYVQWTPHYALEEYIFNYICSPLNAIWPHKIRKAHLSSVASLNKQIIPQINFLNHYIHMLNILSFGFSSWY